MYLLTTYVNAAMVIAAAILLLIDTNNIMHYGFNTIIGRQVNSIVYVITSLIQKNLGFMRKSNSMYMLVHLDSI
jgi:hypothetical protein